MQTQAPLIRSFDYKVFSGLLFKAVGVLVIGHLLGAVFEGKIWQLDRLFNLNLETNVPTWFSSILFASTALAAFGCGEVSSVAYEKRWWKLTAFFFLFLSCDEIALIHENFFGLFRKHIFNWPSLSALSVPWPITVGPFIILLALWFGYRFYQVIGRHPLVWKRMILGIGIFLAGSMGVEFVTNFVAEDPGSLAWHIRSIAEEALEMLGSIFVLSAFLGHLQMLSSSVELQKRQDVAEVVCRV